MVSYNALGDLLEMMMIVERRIHKFVQRWGF